VLDNRFAPENVVKKIKSYEPTDENYLNGTADRNKWEVYGLGKRAVIEGLIYEKFETINEIPRWIKKRCIGIDFGYTYDPTAIVEVGMRDNEIYIDEHEYKTHMLTNEIIKSLKPITSYKKTWSESADPRLIDEIYNAGINIYPVVKGAGSIMAGIEKIKTMQVFVTERSVNVIRELKNYKYAQDKNGKWINEPIDDYNHALDAVRYVVLMEILGHRTGKDDLSGLFF
jgi:phage terminase large subunit